MQTAPSIHRHVHHRPLPRTTLAHQSHQLLKLHLEDITTTESAEGYMMLDRCKPRTLGPFHNNNISCGLSPGSRQLDILCLSDRIDEQMRLNSALAVSDGDQAGFQVLVEVSTSYYWANFWTAARILETSATLPCHYHNKKRNRAWLFVQRRRSMLEFQVPTKVKPSL
jgi:hypothetical protein